MAKFITKVLKIFNPQRSNNGIKLTPDQALLIRFECKKSPLFTQLLIDNLIFLRKNLDIALLDENKLTPTGAMYLSHLLGQKKAYETLLDLLTEQEIELEEPK